MLIVYLKNYRNGFATNSSSTHSIMYKNKDDMLEDMNVMEENFYDRFTRTIAASKEAKIKYIASTIFYNEKVFELMCGLYPEMKKYEELAKTQRELDKMGVCEDVFGQYFRGNLIFDGCENLEATIDYLKFIIDTEDVIIVGGSDEEEFVYDMEENRKQLPSPDSIHHDYYNGISMWKNGNYWLTMDSMGHRIRFNTDSKDCVPSYPELIDLKVTDRCSHNCPFCYMGANSHGKHANWGTLEDIIYNLSSGSYDFHRRKVEFAIGGGNILEYPDLEALLRLINQKGHIANTTLKAEDFNKVCTDEKLSRLFDNFVSAVGVSICDEKDLEIAINTQIPQSIPDETHSKKIVEVTYHLIPEMLGAKKTREFIDKLRGSSYCSFLLLGYKSMGRGKNLEVKKFSDKDLSIIFANLYSVNIDTTFANRYKDWIEKNWHTEHTVTYLEGEYSMYIDAVNGIAYKSSYNLDKPYRLPSTEHNYRERSEKLKKGELFYPIDAFKKIREDNGLVNI